MLSPETGSYYQPVPKYRGERRDVRLVDLFNLVHPTPAERNAEALRALVAGSFVP